MTVPRRNFLQRLLHHFSPRLFSRYLVVGAINSAFGLSVYMGLAWCFQRMGMNKYVAANIAAVLSNALNITFSFLTYKFFVFKTQGNYWREYLRCWLVYGTSFLINFALLNPILWILLRYLNEKWAVPLAGAILIGLTTLFSFVGHSKFSFRKK